ncbi:hypothetical protein GGI03_000106 [Coemansia sp. RSA 2337]|nr:hypothetical protein IW146_001540 [Coemansia sp. RSA 922]KAJ2469809.1 hypothetical protein GGI03_000106 [Coemansia sp. RSA 2337]
MDNLSAFQLLPNHVIKLIVDHVAHSSRLWFDGVTTDLDEYKILQMLLLWVCHNFRAFVRKRFSRVYELTLDNDRDRAEALLCSWLALFKELGCFTHPLAKELRVKLDIKAVFSGKALQLLSDVPYGARSFPLVRKLCIRLTSDNEDCYNWESVSDNDREPEDWALVGTHVCTPKARYVYPSDRAANITAFVQQIKQMVPAVSEIYVYPYNDAKRLLLHCHFHTLDLVQQLFDIVERHTVIAGRDDSMLVYLDLEPIRDLVHLKCSLDSDFYSAWPLIHCNMQTLQFLKLNVGDTELTDLVIDCAGGGYLEYPCLHTLMIHSHREPCPTRKPVIKDAVPFPRLLRLSL